MMKLPYTPVQVAARHAEEDGELAAVARRHAGRLLLAAQPGRAGVRGARRPPRRLRPAAGRGAAASRCRTPSARSGARPRRGDRVGRRVLRRRRRVRDAVVGARLGEGAGLRRRRVRDRARDRRDRHRGSGTAGSRPPRRRTRRSALGGRPVVAARVSEADERERHRGLSHHTQAVLRALPRRGGRRARTDARAGARPATGCRSRTWAAARTTTRRSSQPRSPPASSRESC